VTHSISEAAYVLNERQRGIIIVLFAPKEGQARRLLIQHTSPEEVGFSETLNLLTFWRRNYFFNFSTPVYKMLTIQEPNTLEL